MRRAIEQTEDLTVVGEAGSVEEALAMDRALSPDVAVVDVNLGDGNGIELVRQLRAAHPRMGLVVCTMYEGDEHLLGALEAGASGFVAKSAPVDDVVAAARQAAVSPTSFSAHDIAGAMRRRMLGPQVQLTPRENEILQHLADGVSVAVLSQRLFISQSTAKTHMSKIYEKLGAANRTQAIMAAIRLGLVKADVAR
jgi:DNA-binding NarL/FixJ family response regulator